MFTQVMNFTYTRTILLLTFTSWSTGQSHMAKYLEGKSLVYGVFLTQQFRRLIA